MARDNFTPYTKEILGQSVGYHCVRPGCGLPTTAFNPSTGNMSRLGFAAHDSAASPGGPRFNEELTSEQRKALENGAHLCPTCARLVDIAPEHFPPGTLVFWQQKAMECRQQGMYSSYQSLGLDFKAGCEGAQKFLNICQKISFNDYQQLITWNSYCAMTDLVSQSYPMSVTNPLSAQFPHMVNIQLEMIETLKFTMHEIKNSGCWFYDSNNYMYRLSYIQRVIPNPLEQEQNYRIEKSFELVKARMEDFFNNKNKLNLIVNSPVQFVNLNGW